MRQALRGRSSDKVRNRGDLIVAQIDPGQQGLIKQPGWPLRDAGVRQGDLAHIGDQAEIWHHTELGIVVDPECSERCASGQYPRRFCIEFKLVVLQEQARHPVHFSYCRGQVPEAIVRHVQPAHMTKTGEEAFR
ncbi:hypothetical protein D3C81_1145840 [compost metagenome]